MGFYSICSFILIGVLLILPSYASQRKEYRNDMPVDPDEDFAQGVVQESKCRHNYHERTEAGINRQINFFLHVGYVYNSMSQHFGRCDVALPGFQSFFRKMSEEQASRAETLMAYQNLRGGRVALKMVTAPSASDWGSGLEAMATALELEKSVNQAMLELNMLALQHDDVHSATYLQTTFLNPQVEKIFTISQYITNLERVGPGLGEYMFDKLPQN